jgi:long-chain fatty acid transport protein
MKRSHLSPALAIVAAALFSAPTSVRATNGYFSHGYGTKSKGMAGAGVALPQDALAPATNPAGVAFVGNRLDIGLSLFSPVRKYTVKGAPSGALGTFGLTPGTVKSRRELFIVPSLGFARTLTPNSAWGVAVYGNGGMNTTYPDSAGGGAGTFYGGPAGVNLEQLFIAPTYAMKWNANSAWGVAPVLAYQRFEAKGLSNFAPFVSDGNADNLTDRGVATSTGAGIKLGVQTQASQAITVGASYQTRIKMSRFKKYSDLFAEQGRFDVPATGTIGLAYRVTPTSVVAFDIQKIWYSKVAAVANPFANLFTLMGSGNPAYGLGGDNGPGFGWRDMTVFKLGYQTELNPAWTVRAGISRTRQPIPSSEVLFNILAPGVQEWHLTGGFTHPTGKDGEVSAAITFSPGKTVKGPNPMDAPNQQTIELNMHQLDVEIGWAKKY